MVVLTRKERRAVFVLFGCFLLGAVLFWLREHEFASGREYSAPSRIQQKVAEFKSRKNGKININKATAVELETIPGIGAYLAANIIQYREENRGFYKLDQLKEVKGIGEKRFQKIVSQITLR